MAQVLVVDRAAFFGGDWPAGFVPLAGTAAKAFLDRAAALARYVDRPLAEASPQWKQWIPYCVLRCVAPGAVAPEAGGNHHNPSILGVFRVQRSKGQSEARLHGQWSIGLGGHIEPEDGDPLGSPGPTFFTGALHRELHEELQFRSTPPVPRFLGLLNDDSTPVGQVHAGLVYALDLPGPLAEVKAAVQVREISKMSGGFGSLVEFRDLWLDRLRFETWSQRLVDAGIVGPMGGSTEAEG